LKAAGDLSQPLSDQYNQAILPIFKKETVLQLDGQNKYHESPTRSGRLSSLSQQSLGGGVTHSQDKRVYPHHTSSNVSLIQEIFDSVPELPQKQDNTTGLNHLNTMDQILKSGSIPHTSPNSSPLSKVQSFVRKPPMFKDSAFLDQQDIVTNISIKSKMGFNMNKIVQWGKKQYTKEPIRPQQFKFF